MRILAIDPGDVVSGVCIYDTDFECVSDHGIFENELVREKIRTLDYDTIAIEMIASYGMPVGATIFETCVWIGRFIEILLPIVGEYILIYRKDVKMHLCNTLKGVKDANIRQAILDRFPRTGGGATPEIGTKKEPGPLYGVSGDVWAAIGVALTAEHQIKNPKKE